MERIQAYTTKNLSKMLKNEFPESELNIKADATKKMIAFKVGSMSTGLAYEKAKFASGDTRNLMWECAMKMRQDILQLESIPLEESLSVNSIMAGEAQVPDSVNEFFTTLYTGSSSNIGISKKKQRLVDSTATDVLFATTGGKVLPRKHLSLGLTLKSMTGSKTVTNLINRFGHC